MEEKVPVASRKRVMRKASKLELGQKYPTEKYPTETKVLVSVRLSQPDSLCLAIK